MVNLDYRPRTQDGHAKAGMVGAGIGRSRDNLTR
jgi:hypothetical protein